MVRRERILWKNHPDRRTKRAMSGPADLPQQAYSAAASGGRRVGRFLLKTAKVVGAIGVAGGVAVGGLFAAREPVTKFACGTIADHSELDADHCTKAVAVQMKDATMCDKITGERFKVDLAGKGEKVLIENPPKMECLTAIAAATNNPALCDKVEGVLIANTKIDCLYRVASTNGNAAACGAIGSDTQSRSGSQMTKSGCMAIVARVAAATPAAQQAAAQAEPKAPACPAGSVRQGAGDDAPCACEIKPSGIIYGIFGIGKSSWHTLRPGEECGWWQGIGGIGENLGKDKRACYDTGGTGYDPTEGTCACPSGANWDTREKSCICSAEGVKLKQGGSCKQAQ